MKMTVKSKLLLSFLILGICGHQANAEVYYSGYHDENNGYSQEFQDLLDGLNNSNKQTLFEHAHVMTNTYKGYDLYNRNGLLSCTGFVNTLFSETQMHWGFDLSTHATHAMSPYADKESSRFENWALATYSQLPQHFEVFEKNIIMDDQRRVIEVEDAGFRPQEGDILIFPSRHMRYNDRFYSTGHMVVVVDPDKCIGVHSTSWTYDPVKFKQDVTKKGVMFHKVNRDIRCNNGVWYAWDNNERNHFWTLLRPKPLMLAEVETPVEITPDPSEIIVEIENNDEEIPELDFTPQPVEVLETEDASEVVEVPAVEEIQPNLSLIPEQEEVQIPLAPQTNQENVFLLAVGSLSEAFVSKTANISDIECGILDNNTVLQVLAQNDTWVNAKIVYSEDSSRVTCDTFYIPKRSVSLIKYLSDTPELKLKPINVVNKSLLYRSPSETASVAGYLNPGEKVTGLKYVIEEGSLWMLVNKGLTWIKLGF